MPGNMARTIQDLYTCRYSLLPTMLFRHWREGRNLCLMPQRKLGGKHINLSHDVDIWWPIMTSH